MNWSTLDIHLIGLDKAMAKVQAANFNSETVVGFSRGEATLASLLSVHRNHAVYVYNWVIILMGTSISSTELHLCTRMQSADLFTNVIVTTNNRDG